MNKTKVNNAKAVSAEELNTFQKSCETKTKEELRYQASLSRKLRVDDVGDLLYDFSLWEWTPVMYMSTRMYMLTCVHEGVWGSIKGKGYGHLLGVWGVWMWASVWVCLWQWAIS